MLSPMLVGLMSLAPLPPGLNEFSRLSGRAGAIASIRRQSAQALGAALADGKELLEIEFPPLLETKTQFDDFSNVEVLDANRDFAIQLAQEPEIQRAANEQAALWLCFADKGEAELAAEAWPGAMYGSVTQTYIAEAVKAVGAEPLMPMGSSALDAASAFGALFGGGQPPPAPPTPPAPPPTLQLIVQPGDGYARRQRLKPWIGRHPSCIPAQRTLENALCPASCLSVCTH